MLYPIQYKPKSTTTTLPYSSPLDNYFVDQESSDQIKYWSLKILLELNGHSEFIDKDCYFKNNDVVAFFELSNYINLDEVKHRKDIILVLQKLYDDFSSNQIFSKPLIFEKNLNSIATMLSLSELDVRILELIAYTKYYEIFSDIFDMIGTELTSSQVERIIAVLLDCEKSDIKDALSPNGRLTQSGILTIDRDNSRRIQIKFDMLSGEFVDQLINVDSKIEHLIKDIVKPCQKPLLTLEKFDYLSHDLTLLLPYLSDAIENGETGVNILLYGAPGTGKTELTKVIAANLKRELYEISYTDATEEPIEGVKRLKAYKIAQNLFAQNKLLFMFDEVEDVFSNDEDFNPFGPKRQKNKAWINRILETNKVPTVWITNDVNSIDSAVVRRFDMSIEIPVPTRTKRKEIIQECNKEYLTDTIVNQISAHEHIAPALITRAAKVVDQLGQINVDKSTSFVHVLNNTLKAQGFNEIKPNGEQLPNCYNPQYINTSTDLNVLTQGIKEHQNARLCLYGAAGTGKSAFGKYIAETLNKPVLLKKVSDLQSAWVGECEKNIAHAFEEAKKEKAVLIFDEVDTFLQDRTQAKNSWEISQVNEMLVQMENFDGIFIATTNLMDNLDKASLRRFDLKLEFNFLNPEQSWNMFLAYCKDLKLDIPTISDKHVITNLSHLTPGDFAAVIRQNRFIPVKNVEDFIQRLEDEVNVKNISSSNTMGFFAS